MSRRSDPETRGMTRVWHGAYCRWFDHDRGGHRARAAAWGWTANRLCRWA